jgi:hypothetical protein
MTDDAVRDVRGSADLLLPMAIRAAATLRLADLIDAGATGLSGLAERSGTDRSALGRLLRHLVSNGVFEEPTPDVFALNDKGRTLLDGHPSGCRRWLDLESGMGGRTDLTFVDMLEAVRTGGPVYEARYGLPFWDDVSADPERNRELHSMMGRPADGRDPRLEAFIRSYDWKDVEQVIDVGGGDGSVLMAVLRALPHVKGTLLELPERLEGVALGPHEPEDLAGRCSLIGGSFFDPLPAGLDVYLLTNVLNDWDDRRATVILRRCREAAGPAGRIVVPGGAPIDRSDPEQRAEDLRLLMLLGGHLRTRDDLEWLAEAAGLAVSAYDPNYTEMVAKT